MTKKSGIRAHEIWRKIPGIVQDFYETVRNRMDFYAALLCAVAGFALMLAYYLGKRDGNFPALWCWLLCLYFIFRAFSPVRIINPDNSGSLWALWRDLRGGIEKNRNIWIAAFLITAVYFISHLAGYDHAPWNNYGLFDDAAWDIFITKERCLRGDIFELIYWDDEIGLISRELLFHYYIALLFRLFGYNMFIFNMGLVFLGYITVLFTFLLACEIFQSPAYGFLTGFVLNFFPLEYTQVFMGHRYAICGPVVMISLYFLYRAVKYPASAYAPRRALIGGVFAGFAMESAIMGKQYLWALIACLFCLLFAYRKRTEIWKRAAILILAAALGYILAAFPLYAYIWTHPGVYRVRESSLIREFWEQFSAEGWPVIWEKISDFFRMVFNQQADNRQFSRAFPILTPFMALFVFPGMVISWLKRYYIIFFMIAIPAAGCLVSGSFDFRVLLAAPFLIFAFMFGLLWIFERIFGKIFLKISGKIKKTEKAGKINKINKIICGVYIAAFLIALPGMIYLYNLKRDPDSQFYLRHTDLMASRYIQDVVTGSEQPDFSMKYNEFNRPMKNDDSDVFAATFTSYAHIHAFLQPYDSRRILGLFGNMPYVQQNEEDMRRSLAETLTDYQPTGKDLEIVFEHDPKIDAILDDLEAIPGAEVSEYTDSLDGKTVSMVRFKILSDDIPAFQDGVEEKFGES